MLVPAVCTAVSWARARRTDPRVGGCLGDEAQPNRTSSAGALIVVDLAADRNRLSLRGENTTGNHRPKAAYGVRDNYGVKSGL